MLACNKKPTIEHGENQLGRMQCALNKYGYEY